MFSFFNRKKEDWQLEKQMLLGVFSRLPAEFSFLIDQVNEGLIRGFSRSDSVIANFHKVTPDVPILNKYEAKKEGFFRMSGIEVLDANTNQYTRVDIYYTCHILMGYATPSAKEFRPDTEHIQIRNFHLVPLGRGDYKKAKPLLDKQALTKINPSDVYELILDGKKYYHLKDLEDGDFIGIDEDKKVYKITHDPYGFEELSGTLADILEREY